MTRLMRNLVFRERAIQPSWLDGGYVEFDISRDWFMQGEACNFGAFECVDGEAPAGLAGKMFYIALLYTSPHVEKSTKPFTLPKNEQKDALLYADSVDLDTIETLGAATPVRVGWPITIYGNVIDPDNALLRDTNIFGLRVHAAASGPQRHRRGPWGRAARHRRHGALPHLAGSTGSPPRSTRRSRCFRARSTRC